MKENPNNHVDMSDSPKVEEWPELEKESRDHEEEILGTPARNLEGKGVPKWYDMIDYRKISKFMPKLRVIRGGKAKFTLTTFGEIDQAAQSIFERNKSFFRHRAQVDSVAYYIGIKIMECIYLILPGFYKSKLSLLLESQEAENQIYDEMAIIKEKFKKDVERFVDGIIDEDEVHKKINLYIATFDDKKAKETMGKVLDRMIDKNEENKALDRMRKRAEYNRAKFKVVGDD